MKLVLDASAALRLLLQGDEALAKVLENSRAIIVPDLYHAEVANAFWKYVKSKQLTLAQAEEYHTMAFDLVDEVVACRDLFPEALVLANENNHSVYDCLYLVLAKRHNAYLLTFDGVLKKLAINLKIKVAEQ